MTWSSGHPYAQLLSIQRLPSFRPLRPGFLGRDVLHRDELSRNEGAAAADPGAAQPRLRGDAVLVLAENRLQLGGGSSEGRGGAARDGGHSLRGITRALGEDADAMKLGVGRRVWQLADRRAQPPPGTGSQRGQPLWRRVLRLGP